MAISKLPTSASLKQVMDKFEEISLYDFSNIDMATIMKFKNIMSKMNSKKNSGITLIALVITIVLNCSCLAMERMLNKVNILKI